jgi:hypothetical protein
MESRRSRFGLEAIAIFGSVLAVAIAQIVQPAASPVAVTVAPDGTTVAVTVVASGFAPEALVYVEQCDGVAPSTAQWSPTVHCDLGSSPSPAIADSHGVATFSVTDRNRAFRPFAGESPQALFNCLAPSQVAPKNALPNFTNCTLRVSTSNTAVTADQTFVSVALTIGRAAVVTTTPSSSIRRAVAGDAGAGAKKQSASTVPTRRTAKGRAPASRSSTSPSSVAVATAPSHGRVGFLSFSDSDLTTGYVLVLVGLLVAGLTISLRRRNPRPARTMTEARIVGER